MSDRLIGGSIIAMVIVGLASAITGFWIGWTHAPTFIVEWGVLAQGLLGLITAVIVTKIVGVILAVLFYFVLGVAIFSSD